ncbi:hypothetical protein ACW5R3_05205 [Bizionia sp. KMM 8389]
MKDIDNRFSWSASEIKKEVQVLMEQIDYEKEEAKYIGLVKEYLGDELLFDEWVNFLRIQLHLSIPDEVKETCNVCRGNRDLTDDIICLRYFELANAQILIHLIFFVSYIENNRGTFDSKEDLLSVTNSFFENFEYVKGELIFDADRFDGMILKHSILNLREILSKMDTSEAISEISKLIEEFQTHKVLSKSTDRELFSHVKPQLKFLKGQLKYYKEKLLLEPQQVEKKTLDSEALFRMSNNLIPELSIEEVYDYFISLTKLRNNHGEPYLTNDQLLIFIKSTFVELKPEKQNFNCSGFKKKEIRKIFHGFYFENKNKERKQTGIKSKYFNIMNDAFFGFNKNDFTDFSK